MLFTQRHPRVTNTQLILSAYGSFWARMYIIPNLWIKKQLLFNNINKLFHLTANAKYQRSEVKTIYNNDLRHQQ